MKEALKRVSERMDECLEILNKGEILGAKMARDWEDVIPSLKWQQFRRCLLLFRLGWLGIIFVEDLER